MLRNTSGRSRRKIPSECLWATNGVLVLRVVPISFCAAIPPAPFPLQNPLQRTPAGVRTEALRGRAPSSYERFITAGAIAARTEKILLGLPSPLQLLRQQPLSGLCQASCAGGTALVASLSPERFRGTSAALYNDATSSLSGDRSRCNSAAKGAPSDRPDCNP